MSVVCVIVVIIATVVAIYCVGYGGVVVGAFVVYGVATCYHDVDYFAVVCGVSVAAAAVDVRCCVSVVVWFRVLRNYVVVGYEIVVVIAVRVTVSLCCKHCYI